MLSRPIIALSFIFIIACSVFSSNIISINFYLNQNYIASTLCENRDNPQLHCNGKCQLQKKLNQQEGKDKQIPDKRNESQIQIISSKTFFARLFAFIAFAVKKQFYSLVSCLHDLQSGSIFHPPQRIFI